MLLADGISARSIEPISDSTLKVLILPAHDEIANAGISPDVQKMLESTLSDAPRFSVISFPFKRLTDVPYHMVYDKKYCGPILAKVDCDVIIMTKLITDNEKKPGVWPWSYSIRIYNVRTKMQTNSIQGKNLKSGELSKEYI